jgi:hypothetical protein
MPSVRTDDVDLLPAYQKIKRKQPLYTSGLRKKKLRRRAKKRAGG